MLTTLQHLEAAEKVRAEKAVKEERFWKEYWKKRNEDIIRRNPKKDMVDS